ncbi:hypothetical protein J2787_000865 [Chryseobacterium rhizosphaerae]|uniref:Uncharacterized protein n=2 Tax=Chryseobacterium TaxID=59732 RepID=A0AAE3Y7S6_9FLAO|nr:hypothetical protein [Chryseobacterium rhizosphaerae]MDR6525495.1 hypothetical protein [Chryseobacterium rhizosphaerae]
MFNNLIYKENVDEIHTSEAYFGKILFLEGNLLIPYINLGISNHILNKNDDLRFIDYCYFIVTDMYYLKINEKIIINSLNKGYDSTKSIYLGGSDLIKNQLIYDIELRGNNTFLQLKSSSKIGEKFWTPIATPNFDKNMDENRVERFINNENLPENLLKIFRN